jgi:hypothetical protein
MKQAGCAASMRCGAAMLAVVLALVELPSIVLKRSFPRGPLMGYSKDRNGPRIGNVFSGMNQPCGFGIVGSPQRTLGTVAVDCGPSKSLAFELGGRPR